MGGKGEGFSGTCIKDTWTKPKGRVGSRVGSEDGWGGGGNGEKMETTVYLNNNKKCEKNVGISFFVSTTGYKAIVGTYDLH